jgi:protein transport protein SEC61 subunit beta
LFSSLQLASPHHGKFRRCTCSSIQVSQHPFTRSGPTCLSERRSLIYGSCFMQASPRASSPLTSGAESGPESKSATSGTTAGASGSSNRPSSPTPPGGPRTALRRRAAADHKESLRNARPASTRAAGAGGSSGTMLKLYTDESPGLRVDPVVVLVLSLGFIFSVVGLHGKSCGETRMHRLPPN